MNTSMQKLMRVSGYFRVLVFIATAVVFIYLGYNYLTHDVLLFSSNDVFNELWQDSRANRSILLAIQSPLLILMIVIVYWLQRLLSYFQQGQFFCNEAMHCYLWLIWAKVFDEILGITQHIAAAYYHGQFFDDTRIELEINFGNITTILLMLLIVYLLKAAKEIDAENKEFV